MNILAINKAISQRWIGTSAVVLLFTCSVLLADSKKPSAPAPKAAPAAHAAAPSHGASGAAHGPSTTTSHGPTTSSPHVTTSSPHGATTAGHPTTSSVHTNTASSPGSRPATAATHTGPAGTHTVQTRSGGQVNVSRNGQVREVHANGRTITHGPGGERRIETVRADHSRVVTNRAGHGYIEHGYRFHGHDYARRNYYYHGRAYGRYYRGYGYGGHYYYGYAPGYYYAPAFYGWAYNPWAAPVYYSWGFAANPWYGYYGGFFAPAPFYPSASLWLTDYLISASLAAAYQEHVDAAVAAQQAANNAAASAALTEQVKQQVATEVQYQLALENNERQAVAQSNEPDPNAAGLTRIFSDGRQHIFVAANSLTVTDGVGQECALTEGDVLQLSGPPEANASTANLVVLASKGQECSKGDTVAVQISDVQEMLNHMRASIDQGLGDLKSKAGQSGLPALPQSAAAAPTPSPVAAGAPPDDPNVATELKQEAQQGMQADQQAVSEASTTNQPAAPAQGPAPGWSPEQVEASLGTNHQSMTIGTKTIFLYPDTKVKVTFVNGKVTNIE